MRLAGLASNAFLIFANSSFLIRNSGIKSACFRFVFWNSNNFLHAVINEPSPLNGLSVSSHNPSAENFAMLFLLCSTPLTSLFSIALNINASCTLLQNKSENCIHITVHFARLVQPL
jgi:hypothetical protein